MEQIGKILVSTKSGAGGRKALLCVCGGILVVLAILVMTNARAFYGISREHYRLIAMVLGIAMIAFAAYSIVGAFLGGRSYCDVCENGVIGMTALSRSQPNMPMQKFSVRYNEISNVTESGKSICIYTSYATYEVLARRNRTEAVREIQSRIRSGK